MYPALATAEAMVKQVADVELVFVGTVGGFERALVEQSGVPFAAHHEVQAGPVHGVNPLRMLVSGMKLLAGTVQAFNLLRHQRPQAILSTGGWVSFPLALAARLRRVPLVIFLPDVEPGLTIRILRRFATQVALNVAESAAFFPGSRTVVTGYPLRAALTEMAANRPLARQQAQAHFGLDPARPTLLVFGGSLGARAVNRGFINVLGEVLDEGAQVIHLTGKLDWERAQAQAGPLADHADYHAFPYLHDDMALAFAAADLAICRAGASILAECPLFGLPSILIPLAYSWRYQQVNADYLAARGAAVHLDEGDMPDRLLPLIRELLQDRARLESMRDSAERLACADGAANVAQTLTRLARGER